jgi:two-component system, cell cycle response regulator
MSKKILTVDDSKTIRMIIQRAFRAHDCAFAEAANGEEGLAAAATFRPDLIILDITMPVMDGITMLTKLRQDAALKATPVIMLTAESGAANVAAIAALGISDYLVKPFKEADLLDKAGKVIPLALKPAAAA